eukprot:94545_1
MLIGIIISVGAVLSIVYCLNKYYWAKNITKQAINAVMEASNDAVVVDDIVNCNIQKQEMNTDIGTDEHLEEIEEVLSDEGAQNTVYNTQLVMSGSVKVTNRQPEPEATVGQNIKKTGCQSEDIYDLGSEQNVTTEVNR